MTYGTLISTVTVGAGGAANISFSSIPGTYTDLVLVISARASDGAGTYQSLSSIAINGVTTNQSSRYLYGNGSTATSTSAALLEGWIPSNASTANTFGNWQIYISNYASTTANKTLSYDLVTENNAAGNLGLIYAGLWSNTAAITSLSFNASALFVQYSTASLYGIK